jgi:hypothetical protein
MKLFCLYGGKKFTNKLNLAPEALDKSVALKQGSAIVLKTNHFGYFDKDGDRLQKIRIESLEYSKQGQFQYFNGKQWVNLDPTSAVEISRNQLTKGNLKFIPNSNEFGQFFASATFSVYDGREWSKNQANLYINVNPINHAPDAFDNTIFSKPKTTRVLNLDDFKRFDIDGDTITKIRITKIPSFSHGKLLYEGKTFGSNKQINLSDIQSGKLSFVPGNKMPAGSEAKFSFQVYDGELWSKSKVMTVINMDKPPVIAGEQSGSWTADLRATTLPYGTNTLTVKAFNTAGVLSSSTKDISITAVPTITSMSDDTRPSWSTDATLLIDNITKDTTPSLQGTGIIGKTVNIYNGASLLGSAIVDSNGNWSWTNNTTRLIDENYTFTARYADTTDMTNSSSKLFTIDAVISKPTIDSISNDTDISGDFITSDKTLIFYGSADAGTTVDLKIYNTATSLWEYKTGVTTGNDGKWAIDYTNYSFADGDTKIKVTSYNKAGVVLDSLEKTITIQSDGAPIISTVSNSVYCYDTSAVKLSSGFPTYNNLIKATVGYDTNTFVKLMASGETSTNTAGAFSFDLSDPNNDTVKSIKLEFLDKNSNNYDYTNGMYLDEVSIGTVSYQIGSTITQFGSSLYMDKLFMNTDSTGKTTTYTVKSGNTLTFDQLDSILNNGIFYKNYEFNPDTSGKESLNIRLTVTDTSNASKSIDLQLNEITSTFNSW